MRDSRARMRAIGLLATVALTAAACTNAPVSTSADQDPDAASSRARVEPRPGDEPSQAAPPWPWERAEAGEDVPASVPLDEIRPGGPPPDGIPAIDAPKFEDVAAASEWLQPQDPVLVVELDGDARAYPLAILTYHEIVNDEIAGEPLVVTYCPLCNSGLVFERTVDGEVLDFGTSGRLWNSNLVMYDRATRSLWSQFTGEAIVGDRLGTQLQRVPMQIVALSEFAERWPEGRVLSRDTGHDRPYGTNPYAGYDSARSPFLFGGDTPGPLAQMTRVVTTGGETDPVAYPLDVLRRERVITDTVNGDPVVVLWVPGTASALDTPTIAGGDDVGATGVFRPIADSQELTLTPHGDDRFRDKQTGTTWTVLGEAVEGPLAGTQLERVAHDDTFWFVQYAFRPDTRVVDAS